MSKVTVKEIEYALHGIGDLKAPGEDGYNVKIFEVCWSFIKKDVIAAVMEFFDHNRLYKPFNKTVVNLNL